MRAGTGKILEVRQMDNQPRECLILLDGLAKPAPGQYFQAHDRTILTQAAGLTLFPSDFEAISPQSITFSTPGGISNLWAPGASLNLYGPLGKGFRLPDETGKLAVAAIGDTCAFVLPLIGDMLSHGGEVSLFMDADIPRLPARVEVNPLSNLPDALRWADFLAVSILDQNLDPNFSTRLGIERPGCPAQLLVVGQFPCAGLGACGVCAVKTSGRRTKLACQDGPVFDWKDL
jgi:NAD(P)H-flavin reductase